MVTRGAVQVPAVPDDVAVPGVEKAAGVIVLPLHIAWSGPPRGFDLSDRKQRARVYEQVLREGNDDDVRYFIDVDELLDLWDELFLPRRVHLAWPTGSAGTEASRSRADGAPAAPGRDDRPAAGE